MRASARGPRPFMAGALVQVLVAVASAEIVHKEGTAIVLAPGEPPLTPDTDLEQYSRDSVHRAHEAFVNSGRDVEDQESLVERGPIIGGAEVGIEAITPPPYLENVKVSSWTEGWFGEEGSLTDQDPSTVWQTVQIPAMIEFDFEGYYRIESFEIHNGFPSGAARVRLYAWAKPNWLRISIDELQSGEIRNTLMHPTLTPKVRLSFQTYHMGGVNVTGIRFRGLSSVAVMQAMGQYSDPERNLLLSKLMRELDTRRNVDPSTCPVLNRFPNPRVHDLALWAVRQEGCMCAHQISETLRKPTEEELAMLRHLRKGFYAARGLIGKMPGGKAMHDLVNKSINDVDYIKPPPVLAPARANASYATPFKGEGITIFGLSLAEYLERKHQAGNLSLAELNAHLQLAGLRTIKEDPVQENADYEDKMAAEEADLAAGGELGAGTPETVETEEADGDEEDEPESPTEKVDKRIAAEEAAAAKSPMENGPSLVADPKTLEERLGIELTDVRVVCAAVACMVHAMRTLPPDQKDCNHLLKPLCVSFRGITGCEQSCDITEEAQSPDGCVPIHKPLKDNGVYSYTDMAKKANIAASLANHTSKFNYTEYMESQGYHVNGPPEQQLREDKKVREEIEKARTEDLDTGAARRPR